MIVETLDPSISIPAATRSVTLDELESTARTLGAEDLTGLARIWELVGVDLYNLALWRTGSREDAEDAVQDVFARLAAAPERLRRARRPRTYLLTMAHNAAVEALRRQRRTRPLEEAPNLVENGPDLVLRGDASRVSKLLLELPPPQRATVYLRHFIGLSFSEIGSVFGVSLFTAASRYRLAIQRLRRLLGVSP